MYWSGPENGTRDFPLCYRTFYRLSLNPVSKFWFVHTMQGNWLSADHLVQCSVLIGKLSMQPRRRRHKKPHLKKHRRSFKLHRFCFITLNLSNVSEFFASWVLKVCISVKKKNDKENRCLVSTFSMKREFKEFHVVVVQWRQRNKNTWCTCKVVVSFSYLKPR